MVTAAQRESRRRAMRRRFIRRQLLNMSINGVLAFPAFIIGGRGWCVAALLIGLGAVLIDEFTSWLYDVMSDHDFDQVWEQQCRSWFKIDPTQPPVESEDER